MSLLLKSELRLRMGPRHCQGEVWLAGWSKAPVASCFVSGASESLLQAALDAFDEQDVEMPERVCMQVEDEQLFFTLLPLGQSWQVRQGRDMAEAYFSNILDPEPVRVDVTLTPDGTHWLAAAIYADQVEDWRQVLAERGMSLASLRPALLDDLVALQADLQVGNGLVVLVRSEGVSFISVAAGSLVDVMWERCDLDDVDALVARIRSHLRVLRGELPTQVEGDTPAQEENWGEVCLVPLREFQAQALAQTVSDLGWRMTRSLVTEEEQAA